jgi:Domain of unknown function (DUF4412)
MKTAVALFILLGSILAFPVFELHAQDTFEGTLTWTMTMPSIADKIGIVINFKGLKSEMEENMGSLGSLKMWSDRATRKNYIAMSSVKNGTVEDMGDIGLTTTSTSFDIEPTGRKETIAGYAAEEYVNKNPKGDASMWVTSGLPKDVQYSIYSWYTTSSQDPNQLKFIKDFTDRGLVPVRIGLTIDGKTAMTMEFVKFERKHLSDALFIPPTDVHFDSASGAAQPSTH